MEELSQIILKELNVDSLSQFDFVKTVGRMTELGFPDADIGLILGVVLQGEPIGSGVITQWKQKYPQLQKYQSNARRKVVHYALAKMVRLACGYDFKERTVKYNLNGEGQSVGLTEIKESYKHKSPDFKALAFLICNLDKSWQSINKTDVDGRSVQIHLDGKTTAKEIGKLAGKLFGKTQKKNVRDAPELCSGDTEVADA